jgi:hypothetical protein
MKARGVLVTIAMVTVGLGIVGVLVLGGLLVVLLLQEAAGDGSYASSPAWGVYLLAGGVVALLFGMAVWTYALERRKEGRG